MYPVLNVVIRRKWLLPAGCFLLALLSGVYVAWRTDVPDFAVAGLVLGLAGAGAAKLLVEVLDLLADMLLPK